VTYYLCPHGVEIAPPIWAYGQGTACGKLKKKLSDAYKTPFVEPQLAMDVHNNIVKSLSFQAQDALLKLMVINGTCFQYNCMDTLYNPLSYIVKSQNSDCIRLYTTFEPDGIKGGGIWNILMVVCGRGFCQRSTPFCIKPDRSICYGNPVKMQIGTCNPTATACPNGSLARQICSPPCERL